MNQLATQSTNLVAISSFVAELSIDLPVLFQRYPEGVPISVLQEEYGETVPRIVRVLGILEGAGAILVKEGFPPLILPTSYIPKDEKPYQDLSELQQRMFAFLVATSGQQHAPIRSSYYQLARIMKCSAGGARSTLERLLNLLYITLLEAPQQGHTNSLLLQVNTEKIAVDSNLPT